MTELDREQKRLLNQINSVQGQEDWETKLAVYLSNNSDISEGDLNEVARYIAEAHNRIRSQNTRHKATKAAAKFFRSARRLFNE